jgi:hypothetical protein
MRQFKNVDVAVLVKNTIADIEPSVFAFMPGLSTPTLDAFVLVEDGNQKLEPFAKASPEMNAGVELPYSVEDVETSNTLVALNNPGLSILVERNDMVEVPRGSAIEQNTELVAFIAIPVFHIGPNPPHLSQGDGMSGPASAPNFCVPCAFVGVWFGAWVSCVSGKNIPLICCSIPEATFVPAAPLDASFDAAPAAPPSACTASVGVTATVILPEKDNTRRIAATKKSRTPPIFITVNLFCMVRRLASNYTNLSGILSNSLFAF